MLLESEECDGSGKPASKALSTTAVVVCRRAVVADRGWDERMKADQAVAKGGKFQQGEVGPVGRAVAVGRWGW